MDTQRSDDSKIDDFLKTNFEENIWTQEREESKPVKNGTI
jgi:hypothetical protein